MSNVLLESKHAAVVTGAGRSIGRKSALICAREGARAGVLHINADAAANTERTITASGGKAVALVADLRDEAQVGAGVEHGTSARGGLDVVNGCAGVQLAGEDHRADRLSLEVWKRTININLTRMFLIAKHGIRLLLKARGRAVVLTCSPTGLFGCAPGCDACSSSKAGSRGSCGCWPPTTAPRGIRVNGGVPGYPAHR
jgi:NAD(P)-dependent dehydrogenase (short-subunit alcohol dehydrogenase family)